MARFRFRLEDPNSGEFRIVVTHADTEDAALAVVMAQEAKKVAFRMDPEELAKVEALAADGVKAAAGRLHMHHQAEPYRVVSVHTSGEG